MPTIEGHHDFEFLEARLVELIRETKAGDAAGAFAPVAVIVPSTRLRDHLQTVLAEKMGAVLGVRLFHHVALAREAADAAGAKLPRIASARVLEAILGEALKQVSGGLAAYAESRPGSVAALLATMNDLREAGVDPAAANALGEVSERSRDLLKVYAAYSQRLTRLGAKAIGDRSGLIQAARPHVAAFASRFRLIVHYGAYELIGLNLDLMKAAERSGARIVFLMPSHPTSPAFAYARRGLADQMGCEVAPISLAATSGRRLLGVRLPDLYDETAAPPALAGRNVALFHAQGAAAELREVALRILALHRDEGIQLSRIGIIARSLAPYAPLLRPTFDEYAIPFTTSATLGALREARALAALQLARAAFAGYERQPLIDLFRSGLWKRRAIGAEAHAWERLSREWGITGGVRMWTVDLPRWLDGWEAHVADDADEGARAEAARLTEARRAQARALAEEVRELQRIAQPVERASSWPEWADATEALFAKLIDGFGADDGGGSDRGVAAVTGLLEEMRDLDDAGIRFESGAALARFERGLRELTVPAAATRGGGVQVLDAMQARGLAFDALFLIGFNSGLFPRRPREDPFLDEGDRRRLREGLSAPLPVPGAAREEEHLLLAHLLGAARQRIVISWQRADDEGRAKVPSLALREVARVTLGDASLDAVQKEKAAFRVAAHPADAALDAARHFGLLPPREARLGAALSIRSPEALLALAKDMPEAETLAAGLRMLAAIEKFSPADLSYDAQAGDSAPPPAEWSPSRLERLGACPQQYFFSHILHVDEMEGISEAHEVDAREMGLRVHGVLHDIYKTLLDSGDLSAPGADPKRAARRAFGLVSEEWSRHTADLAERMHRRYPILWEMTSRLWRNALETFVLHDVAALVREGGRIVGLELPVRASLSLSGGRRLEIRGRFDRVSRRESGEVVISDYKTGGRIERHVEIATALKGTRFQIPLYALMAEDQLDGWGLRGASVEAEALGVGPSFAGESVRPADGEESGYPARAELNMWKFNDCREGFVETLGVLTDLAAGGLFPLNEESGACDWCPYRRACRKTHAPTLARLRSAAGAAKYLLLRGKSTRAKKLADVKGASERGEEES